MKQLSCLRSMSSVKQQWLPEQEAEPGTEVKAGDLYLVSSPEMGSSSSPGPSRKRPSRYPVHVRVYRSSFGHYAVLTAGLRAPATYLNLRTCHCRPSTPSSPSFSYSSSSSCPPSPSSPSASSSSPSKFSSYSVPPPRSPGGPTSVSGNIFRVELGGGEGQVIYFEVPSAGAGAGVVGEWVEAFQGVAGGPPSPGTISPSLSPVIPRSPIMPTLQESMEELEEEDEEEISGLG